MVSYTYGTVTAVVEMTGTPLREVAYVNVSDAQAYLTRKTTNVLGVIVSSNTKNLSGTHSAVIDGRNIVVYTGEEKVNVTLEIYGD